MTALQTGGARCRATGPAWALADVLAVGCGGVATVPATTSAEDVARLVALGVAVVLSCWVTVATWEAA